MGEAVIGGGSAAAGEIAGVTATALTSAVIVPMSSASAVAVACPYVGFGTPGGDVCIFNNSKSPSNAWLISCDRGTIIAVLC